MVWMGPTTSVSNTIFDDKVCDNVEVKFLIKPVDHNIDIFGYLHKWEAESKSATDCLGRF